MMRLLCTLCLVFGLISVVPASAAAPDPLAAWVGQHRELRVGVDPEFGPIEGLDAAGATGYAGDLLKRLAQQEGLHLKAGAVASRQAALAALDAHRVDVLLSAFVDTGDGPGRRYSVPYLRLPCAVFLRKGENLAELPQLDGRRLALLADHGCRQPVAALLPKAQLTAFPSVAQAATALAQGKVDALIGDLLTTRAALAKLGLKDRIVAGSPLPGDGVALAFAVRGDWPELKALLDRSLAGMDVAQETALRQRWIRDLMPEIAPAADTSAAALPAGHAEAVRAALAALPTQPGLTADQRTPVETALTAALADETQADQLASDWRALRDGARRAETEATALEDGQDQDTALLAWRSTLPERANVDQLETLLANERAALADARSAVAAGQAELARALERPGQVRDELKLAQAAVDAAANASAASAGTEPPALAEALRLQRQAAQRLAQVRVAKLEEELRTYEPRLRLISAQLRERQRLTAEHQEKVDTLQKLVLDRTAAVASELTARQRAARTALGDRRGVLLDAANLNVGLSEELEKAVARLSEARHQREEMAGARSETEQALKNTKERVAIGGVSEAVGLILLGERRKLKPLPTLKHNLAALQTDLAQARIRLVDLREMADSLQDVGAEVNRELKRLAERGGDVAATRSTLFGLVNARAELVPRMIVAQTRLCDALADAEQELHGLTLTTAELRDLLDARLLWTPSHTPVNLAWFGDIATGTLDTLRAQHWTGSVRLAARTAWAHPLQALAGIAAFGALLVLRRRVPKALDEIAAPMRRIRTDRYRLSGRALVLTLFATLPFPFLFWLLARLWQSAAGPGYPFTDAISLALYALIAPVAALSFIYWLNVDKGLAHYHFRWAQMRRTALERLRRPAQWIVLPVLFFIVVQFIANDENANAGIGRALFVLVTALTGGLCWRAFGPGALWTQRAGTREPNRVRQFVRLGLTGFQFGLAALALAGYYLTAITLTGRLFESGIVVLVVATLHGMAMRWLVLGERRLALKRMEERRETEAEPERADDDIEALPDLAEPEEITLASINAQTRRLLRALTVVALVGALLWVWNEVAPALSFLGERELWHSGDAATGDRHAVSLRLLMFGSVTLMLTWVATRNLPGLLEIGVLRRIDVDAPTRYAITAVCRYAIAIAGTLLGLSLLGLRWSQLQWLAAALSVGLGFGLQEIFGNFVSGLIVLLERPMRVGDVISIRGVEGTVARIRTRATTVIDWDNKEVVIPNKTFITDQLTNWTLSDQVTRLVLKVGVAYSSDPDVVRALLLDLARNHPKVLKEPPPNCWFLALGTSTLDFELRVFVSGVMDRNPVRNDLHASILRECRARGIEIAVPQMEVWMHAVKQPAPPTVPEPPNSAR